MWVLCVKVSGMPAVIVITISSCKEMLCFNKEIYCISVFLYTVPCLTGRVSRGCDRMVVGFTTTHAISAYHL